MATREAPTPIAPPKAGNATSAIHGRSPSEVERLGMGVARLGFGQIGTSKAAASSAPAPKKLGFGSVGASKAPVEGKCSLSVDLHIHFDSHGGQTTNTS